MTAKFNPALIIVDLQEDFLPPNGSLAVSEGRTIIPNILELLNLNKYNWKAIIATKDWHPSNHISFASQHGQEPYTTKVFKCPTTNTTTTTTTTQTETATDTTSTEIEQTKTQVLWPDHCIQAGWGSSFPEEFAIIFNDLLANQPIPTALIKKGYLQDREYYSCFKDVWGLHHTECEEFLKKNDITDVYTVGIAYDYCVLNSSIDAADLGFKTFVIKDVTKGVNPADDDKTEGIYSKHGVKIVKFNGDELKKVIRNV